MTRPFTTPARTVGDHIRRWRQRRRLSQLAFALDVEISQKHLSFIESGRSVPSRAMILRLAERLDVPLRERNLMLLAAGYAPLYPERSLDDPALAPARRAIDLVLEGHAPFPALAIDRHWTMVAANAAVSPFVALAADRSLTEPPVNVLRLSLHPAGLAPHILNLAEWRAHLLDRLRHQIEVTADPVLMALMDELKALPAPDGGEGDSALAGIEDFGGVLVPLRLATPGGVLSFFSTTTVFGTPVDITLAELAIEAFFPADEATAAALSAPRVPAPRS
ncbi:helix-turn-helix domain-containing protein [Chelatococcus composti]|jgi:Predicted transcriptional regulators|uniref:Transcriptional regulator with XRE-family HTH domain n=1 Tax=Chelatococcus composti TaxID=1743235 RepID=A0A841K8T7_9HYPH|nr:helix-turn-helix transcriptional regulator [Chelatococcus composti]MBB6169258.1 transcriptional regulator with XRE-family HTH domain [Chelatococcus composti]MBS7735863.1 helix-turn-helix transcriptional regulator [Chelatococcus composti]PZN44424.1 MAG: transcriptional regulator [Pseudomonadota bacterium]GGG46366.1 transcriptional regulator [Chelatococcus composti]